MAHTSLLSDNAARDYPFLKGTSLGFTTSDSSASLPRSAIVAAGFTLGPGTGFIPGQHQVFLTSILRQDNQLLFVFTSDAPGLLGQQLVFSRHLTDPQYTVEYADLLAQSTFSLSVSSSTSSSTSSSVTCDTGEDFAGFLITGPLAELTAALPHDGDELSGASPVEPALLQSLVGAYVRSLNLANADRTRYKPPTGCKPQCWPFTPQSLYVNATCLQASIGFEEGYNMQIRQDDRDNSLTFGAATGGGAGLPCSQVPVFPAELPPHDSLFFEGGPSCAEVVRTLNGIAGAIVPFAAGAGVTTAFDPTHHKISLNVDLHDLAICTTDFMFSDASLSHSSVSTSVGPCDCGELP